jgi:hypothetical protein
MSKRARCKHELSIVSVALSVLGSKNVVVVVVIIGKVIGNMILGDEAL